MAYSEKNNELGKILVDFSNLGAYPLDYEILETCDLRSQCSTALASLSAAKANIEIEIKATSKDYAEEFENWIKNTKRIQEDIIASRKLALEIVQIAEEDEKCLEKVQENKLKLNLFKEKKSQNQNLLSVLRDVQKLYNEFSRAEEFVADRQFTSGLIKLQDTYKSAQRILHGHPTQVVRLFDQKFSNLRKIIHEELLKLWRCLIFVDTARQKITISKCLPAILMVHADEKTELSNVLTGLKNFEDIEELSRGLCVCLDDLILRPRTMVTTENLSSISVKDSSILLGPSVCDSVKCLVAEIKEMIKFLIHSLPSDLLKPLSKSMKPILSQRILQDWFGQAVPSSPAAIWHQGTLAEISEFAIHLDSINWPGFDDVRDWIEKYPKLWLEKRRQTTLEWVRNQVSSRSELPLRTEKVEIRIHEKDEIGPINTTGISANEDWDAAWGADEDLITEKSKQIVKDANDINQEKTKPDTLHNIIPSDHDESLDDDVTEAWGWGDEEVEETLSEGQGLKNAAIESDIKVPTSLRPSPASELIEMPWTEEYRISHWPNSILAKVAEIYEDYATLILNEENPVFPAASGLCALPAQVLAMYRAVSSDYYALYKSGNMLCFNDSIWLAGKLIDFMKNWMQRSDVPLRYRDAVKFEDDAALIESFGRQAYSNELNVQKSAVHDLLGGARNFFQQENSDMNHLLSRIRVVISQIIKNSNLWEEILSFSSWASATGAMVNDVATKIVHDVFHLPDISVDGIERITSVISQVEQLDDLFAIKSKPEYSTHQPGTDVSEGVSLTPKYADKWMKMKFLSEVLKSNLTDVKFLWFESDLSLYFSIEEIVELIQLSFVMNAGARGAIKEIKENPRPRGDH